MAQYTIFKQVLFAALLMASLGACNSGAKGTRHDGGGTSAKKAAVDSSRIISLVDLYRATRFEDLPTALAHGPEQVYKLTFHGRQMGQLPPEVAHFTYLASLDVAFNELSELPEELSQLHYLQGFYAHGNQLTDFPSQVILLPLLDRLNLGENLIKEIPPELVHMDQLSSLNLEKNQIMKIPVELYALDGLKHLNLGNNGLSEIPEGISAMRSLEKLDLSFNQLTRLPREIATMGSHLKELQIHGNQIPREEIDWFMEAMPSTQIRF